ncbi:Symplekin/Pta [Parasponia andersonii]|uniref:Symplekin/Pta n=1 Tax=Parasponia andersonii TaxID=3476 RepID=A0A2P5D4T1_PARAD|nr:Symplekin/Pta [Parasponia andersonii]
MAEASRDQALSLLAAANNHGDLAVKLSSLRQAKDILLSVDPSFAAELFPYLVDLHSSPELLVRKSLLELVEEIGLKAMEHSSVLMPVFLTLLRDEHPIVARQSIISGSNIFSSVLEEMALQFHRLGKVERWLEELWSWMAKFKDAVFTIALEPVCVATKLVALKFLETYVMLFTSDTSETEAPVAEGIGRVFNISWLVGAHPVLDPYMLMSEANRTLGVLLNLLQSASSLPGPLTITVVNCLAAIARKRPLHYSTILNALLDFNPNFELLKGCHASSILYSVRTALLGFLRSTNPAIMESRDKLVRALRAMNAGDAADQVIRQVDKMIKNAERALRDARLGKDDQLSSQLAVTGDPVKKRSVPLDNEDSVNTHEMASKRNRYGPETYLALPVQNNDFGQDGSSVNGLSHDLPLLDGELNPVEKMIAVIGALLAEGDRGAESLKILISKVHPDLLADIVITNMRHLPLTPPPITGPGNFPVPRQISSLNSSGQGSLPINSVQSPTLSMQMPGSSAGVTGSMVSDLSTANNLPNDSKRDPRRDPRRLDPRRMAVLTGLPSTPTVEDANSMQSEFDGSISLRKSNLLPVGTAIENSSGPVISKEEEMESPLVSGIGQLISKVEVLEEAEELAPTKQVITAEPADSAAHTSDDSVAVEFPDVPLKDEADTSCFPEFDPHSPVLSSTSAPEDTCHDLPQLPLYVELTQEQQQSMRKFAIKRIIDSYKHLCVTDCSQMRLALLARLVAQMDADDEVVILVQKHVVVDYQEQKGHELVLHVLYHLYSLTADLDSVGDTSYPAAVYEKFLLAVATSLLGLFPASDKSYSKLLGEVPVLPDSALKLLGDLCLADVTDQWGKDIRDVERVTQGLGAVWSLILGRPRYRQACLDIALKCAVHAQDEIRAKAIRLVANKLYQLSYISENIEQFATNMLLSAVNNHSDSEHLQSGSSEQGAARMVGSLETSVSDSQISDSGNSENDSTRKGHPVRNSTSTMSLLDAQRLISLFFALCSKKPNLLQLVFNIYGRAPKTVKQAFHRHIPILIRALGSSNSDLLSIISDPPQGSENLLTLVLQILTQETTPAPDLIATVKHLYETKLKDVSILIPMLSSLSKNEVLPIFPRLVALPLEKFQMALAHILQGSAHTGPALTPAEVLVAIHGIVPEKDGLALKKITDACSACFEQRTVFTQQVLAKALSQMVDQTPLPLLFMRTVIQSIDAFPSLVDFVMEILSKLVSKQVWKMPKLWVGFLKCVSQTQPHSFHVLLQLPPPQLESALNKHASLRSSLAAFASQPSLTSSLPRSTLSVLGLANERHMQQQPLGSSSFNSSDASSSVRGATPS